MKTQLQHVQVELWDCFNHSPWPIRSKVNITRSTTIIWPKELTCRFLTMLSTSLSSLQISWCKCTLQLACGDKIDKKKSQTSYQVIKVGFVIVVEADSISKDCGTTYKVRTHQIWPHVHVGQVSYTPYTRCKLDTRRTWIWRVEISVNMKHSCLTCS